MKFSELLAEDTSRRSAQRGGDLAWHRSIEDDKVRAASPAAEREARTRQNLAAAKAKIAKQKSFMGRLKSFLEKKSAGPTFRISESFDMNDVVSRLSGLENGNSNGEAGTVSFGVEDDDGNLMKVTVRADQAAEFEQRLADELADAMRRKEVTGAKTGISMAELLFNLNSEFDIVDVQFPTIPTDGVYNADKVQYGIDDTAQQNIGLDDDLAGFPDELGADGAPVDPMGAPTTGPDGAVDPNGMPAGLDGEQPLDGGEGGEDAFFDDESVEQFPEETADTNANPESLLTSILNMLKADAEAKTAEANAKAEEARAKQAEYTAIATKNAVEEQEEIARMEAEVDKQKQQEKEARRIADLAKYRVNNASASANGSSGKVAFAGTRTFGESAGEKPTFAQFLDLVLEADEFDTVQSLSREKANIRMQYAPQQGDTPEAVAYKREAAAAAMIEVNAKLRRVRAAERYKNAMAQKDKEAQKTQQAQPAQRPGQQPQQGQTQQQGATGVPANEIR